MSGEMFSPTRDRSIPKLCTSEEMLSHPMVSHPRVTCSETAAQSPLLANSEYRGLQIMDTRMGFPCPFHSAVIDSIILTLGTGISANLDVRGNVVPPWRVRQAHSGSIHL